MSVDLNGDGFLGNGRYVIGQKRQLPLLSTLILVLLLTIILTTFIFLALAYLNNDLGVEALQTMIAGQK